MKTRLTTILAGFALLCTSVTVFADSVSIQLKSGSTWRGDDTDAVKIEFTKNGVPISLDARFERIEDLYVVVKEIGGSKRQWTIFRADITALKTLSSGTGTNDDANADDATKIGSGNENASKSSDAYSDKQLGVFLLPLKGSVGTTFRAAELEALIEEADKYGPGQIIVLDIDSPGGFAFEMYRLHEVIVEAKRRHRVVAWITDAISAAAATALNCDELYFRTNGTLGAITAHVGGQGIPEKEQQDNLTNLRKMMITGGRPDFIADPMVFARAELSYDVDPVTGEVTWRPDAKGQFVLSDSRSNLVFISSEAVHSKFADGIADTKEQLAKLLGLPKYHEKSQLGFELAKDIDALTRRANEQIPLLMARLNYAGAGRGTLAVLQKRIQTIEQLIRWWDLHENVCIEHLIPPKDFLQEQLKLTREQIARLRGR